MKATDTISTVGQALDKVGSRVKGVIPDIESPNPQFGFWFRGQIDATWEILPSLWVNKAKFDEASMTAHFKLLRPEHEAMHKSDFDWLTLMQHHGLPTRLVDWTENLLVSLFFAAWREGSNAEETKRELAQDGALFLLSARRLNQVVTDRTNIAIPSGFHTVARAVLSRSSTLGEWKAQMKEAEFSLGSTGAELLDLLSGPDTPDAAAARQHVLSTPIAVFPSRRNDRLVAQTGTFTIHGGKLPHAGSIDLPLPQHLDELNDALPPGKQFLWKSNVNNKKMLLEELEAVGIHQGTIFPDLTHQSQFLKRIWNTNRV